MQTLLALSKIFVFIGIFSSLAIAFDLRRHPQQMGIMDIVWVLTGLWAGIFALWAYFVFGRTKHNHQMPQPMKMSMDSMSHDMSGDMKMPMKMAPERSKWQSVVVSTLHCGAGCTAADIIGEWFLFFVPVAIGGSLIVGGWVLDYVLALVVGVGFQYLAIRGMGSISRRGAVSRAAKADFLSLTAWQVGMYGWMSIVIFVFADGVPPVRTSFVFWFMMQVAMWVGFLLSLPVNALLIKWGIKKPM